MIRRNTPLLLCLLLLPAGIRFAKFRETPREGAAPNRNSPHVLIQTELGDIEVEVDSQRAPATAENFLKYVDAGRYEGGRFHRAVKLDPDNQPDKKIKIEVIQAGVNPEKEKRGFPPIRLERTNLTGLKHRNGVISMAR